MVFAMVELLKKCTSPGGVVSPEANDKMFDYIQKLGVANMLPFNDLFVAV